MSSNQLQDAPVEIVRSLKASELEPYKFRNPKLPVGERFKPVLKFSQVLWFYRLTDLKSGNFGVEVDNTRVIAVI